MGHTRVTQLVWVGGSNEFHILDTRDLQRHFGVKDDEEIRLLEINLHNTTAAASVIFIVDPRLKGVVNTPTNSDIGDTAIRGKFTVAAADGDTQRPRRLYGLPCRDEIHLKATVAATYFIDFTYEVVSGGMYLADDLALNIGDITQVTPDRTPGQELFQVGPISQIGGIELPE